MGTIVPDAAIDLKNSYLASVCEEGSGYLNRIYFNKNYKSACTKKLRGFKDSTDGSVPSSLNRTVNDSNLIIFEEIGTFNLTDHV